MRVDDFDYDLPESLIAAEPLPDRSASRLLTLDGRNGAIQHRLFSQLPYLLCPGDLLVLNNTRVMPARLLGHKASGGAIEVLIERLLDGQRALAHTRASKAPKPGSRLWLENAIEVEVLGREGDLFLLQFDARQPVLSWLEQYGHMPLPPYIKRADRPADRERYQTVYAEKVGAVAAPTAGLHFTPAILNSLRARGVAIEHLTLHVGAGTFQSPRVARVQDHQMHAEYLEVSPALCDAVAATRTRGGRVVAVGTTVVRALETASQSGSLQPYQGDTRIFIYPGFRFRTVDALITNFHLPQSTLLMLVSAFAGRANVLAAYRQAVAEQYRFFSYGDAMFLYPPCEVPDAV